MSGGEATEATSRAPRSTHLPGLDALRAIAVVAVVMFHLDLSFIPGGFLGVSLFFTLSGYLITRNLLLETWQTGRVSLPNFWARRARRLFPAAWFVLAAISLTAALSPRIGRGIGFDGGDVLASLFNVANWRFLDSGSSYASLFRVPSPVLHFWSLAIEEQAYIIVAVLVALVAWRKRTRSATLLGFVAFGLAVVSWALPFVFDMSVSRTYYGTDTRIGEILAGVALAAWRHGAMLTITRRAHQWVWMVTSLMLLVVFMHTTHASSESLANGMLPFISLVSCAAILVAVSPDSPLARLGTQPMVAGLGRLSYVIYLVHWPVILLFRWRRVSLGSVTTFVGVFLVVALLAWLIARFVEVPIRSRQWSHRTVMSAGALTVAIILGATTLVHPPLSAADQTLARLEAESGTFGRDVAEAAAPDTTDASGDSPTATTSGATEDTSDSTTRTTTRHTGSGPSGSSSDTADTDDTDSTGTDDAGSTGADAGPDDTTDDTTHDSADDSDDTGMRDPKSPTTTVRSTTSTSSTSTSTTSTTAAPQPLRVRALGDSIMLSLALVTPQAADGITYTEAQDDMVLGCGVTDFGDDDHAAQCGDRAAAWAAATPTVDADVAVIMSCQWETISRDLPGGGTSNLGDPAFDEYVLQSYTAAIDDLLTSGVPKVLWVRCPYPSQTVGIEALSADFRAGRDPARFDVLNDLIERAVAGYPGSACTVPFDAWMNGRVDDATLRPDGEHYDVDNAGEAGAQFAADVVAAAENCR